MPRPAKGPRLYLAPARHEPVTGRVLEPAHWTIRDGRSKHRLGLGPGDCPRADDPRLAGALADWIAARYRPPRRPDGAAADVLIADVLSIYLSDRAPRHARPAETAARILRLLDWWKDRSLADVGGASCRAYAAQRGPAATAAARRELEDLRAAIGHYAREYRLTEKVTVTLPPRPPARERWLTRAEAARLIRAAWRAREVQKGTVTARHPRRHVARAILVMLYTGTRAAAVLGAATRPGEIDPASGRPRGFVDVAHGVFYRRGEGVAETKKRQPPIVLPDRLAAHIRRWHRLGLADAAVIEYEGRPVRSIRKAFAAASRDAGLAGTGVTPHTCRHTSITWALQNGGDPWEVQGFAGVGAETMERTYAHHHPDHMSSARRAVTARPGAVALNKIDTDKKTA